MIGCVILTVCTSYSIRSQIRRVQASKEEDRNGHLIRYKRSVKTLYYIIVSFAFCYFPLFVFKIIGISDVYDKLYMLMYVALTLCFLNSSINPCIYCGRVNDVRKAVLSIVRPPPPS